MPRLLRRSALVSLLSLLAVAWLASASAAEHHEAVPAPEWDQEKVSTLARQLADAANRLQREMARQKPQQQVGSGQARAMMQFRDNIRVARDTSRSLANALEGGQGREETSPTYRRLMTLVRDARETARRLFIAQPALGIIDEANAALDGLAPFYPDIKPG